MRSALVLAAALLLLGPSRAGEEPTPAPQLPFEAFGPRTLVVVRVKLAGITADRAEQALRAVFPPSYPQEIAQKTITEARQTLAQVQGAIGQPMREAGLEYVFVLLDGPDTGEVFDDVEPRLAIPVRGIRARVQIEAVRQVAGSAGLSVKLVPGCVVLFKGTLPASDFLTMDEAPFAEAFAAVPDDDIVMVGVPQQKLRGAMREWQRKSLEKKASKEGEEESARLMHGARDLVDADWFCVSVQLGPEPALRLRVRMQTEEAAARLRSAVDAFCDFLKEDWNKRSVSTDGTQAYDPAIGHKMVDAARLETKGAHAILDLTAVKLRTFVEGYVAAAQWVADGIADLMGDDDEDTEKKE